MQQKTNVLLGDGAALKRRLTQTQRARTDCSAPVHTALPLQVVDVQVFLNDGGGFLFQFLLAQDGFVRCGHWRGSHFTLQTRL